MLLLMYVCVFFFFQAEDGIRDLVRSRGLGDVYKRQGFNKRLLSSKTMLFLGLAMIIFVPIFKTLTHLPPVSYTHLTLPTSDLV